MEPFLDRLRIFGYNPSPPFSEASIQLAWLHSISHFMFSLSFFHNIFFTCSTLHTDRICWVLWEEMLYNVKYKWKNKNFIVPTGLEVLRWTIHPKTSHRIRPDLNSILPTKVHQSKYWLMPSLKLGPNAESLRWLNCPYWVKNLKID